MPTPCVVANTCSWFRTAAPGARLPLLKRWLLHWAPSLWRQFSSASASLNTDHIPSLERHFFICLTQNIHRSKTTPAPSSQNKKRKPAPPTCHGRAAPTDTIELQTTIALVIGPHEISLRAPTAATPPGIPILNRVAITLDTEVLTPPKAPTLTMAPRIPITCARSNSSISSNLGGMVAKGLKDMIAKRRRRVLRASGLKLGPLGINPREVPEVRCMPPKMRKEVTRGYSTISAPTAHV